MDKYACGGVFFLSEHSTALYQKITYMITISAVYRSFV